MTFLYPLGLLGLIGIPVLIVIYIIKSKYTEQTVSSTYLWTLSERFLKRRNPISRITGIISLILQLLCVLVISLIVAHPMITVPGAANEYCFILDASGSMNIEQNGVTRYELGKDEIAEVIDGAVEGSRYTLVYVGDATTLVYESLEDKRQATKMLNDTQPSFAEGDYAKALQVAQEYFSQDPSVKTYLVTDKTYLTANNVEVITVGDTAVNYGVDQLTHVLSDGILSVQGTVQSYGEAANLTAELYLDDHTVPDASGVLVVAQDQTAALQLTCPCEGFSSFRVRIAETDAMGYDNELIVFNPQSESSYRTLLVSETPFFFESAIGAVNDVKIDVMTPEQYAKEGGRGYGLYIFDSYTPAELPDDGSVWLVNQTESLANSGFSVQGEVELERGEILSPTSSSSSIAKSLTKDLLGNEIVVKKYVKYGLYRNFTTLYSYQNTPIVFAGTNAYGNRQVVFAFSLHDSNLPLLLDFTLLVKNMFAYSFPDIVENVSYYCGDMLELNVVANCESIRVEAPSGEVNYLDVSTASAKHLLTEVGVHKITVMVAGAERRFEIYSALPTAERQPVLIEQEFSLSGTATDEGFDGVYDTLAILFIALVVLFIADWGVYCYEKYQLQ